MKGALYYDIHPVRIESKYSRPLDIIPLSPSYDTHGKWRGGVNRNRERSWISSAHLVENAYHVALSYSNNVVTIDHSHNGHLYESFILMTLMLPTYSPMSKQNDVIITTNKFCIVMADTNW